MLSEGSYFLRSDNILLGVHREEIVGIEESSAIR